MQADTLAVLLDGLLADAELFERKTSYERSLRQYSRAAADCTGARSAF